MLECLRAKFADLKAELSLCGDLTVAQQEHYTLLISTLRGQLNSLTISTTAEIDGLNTAIADLHVQLSESTDAYNELVAEDAETAATFIAEISDLQKKYDSMIEERSKFKQEVESLSSKVDIFSKEKKVDLQSISNEICVGE